MHPFPENQYNMIYDGMLYLLVVLKIGVENCSAAIDL